MNCAGCVFKVKLFIMGNGLTWNVSVRRQEPEIFPARVGVSPPPFDGAVLL